MQPAKPNTENKVQTQIETAPKLLPLGALMLAGFASMSSQAKAAKMQPANRRKRATHD